MDDLHPTTLRGWVALVVFLSVEWWLGRTHRTRAGSMVDLAWTTIVKLGGMLRVLLARPEVKEKRPMGEIKYVTIDGVEVPKEQWELYSAITLLVRGLKRVGKADPAGLFAAVSGILPDLKTAIDGASEIPDELKADHSASIRAGGLFLADLDAALEASPGE